MSNEQQHEEKSSIIPIHDSIEVFLHSDEFSNTMLRLSGGMASVVGDLVWIKSANSSLIVRTSSAELDAEAMN